MTYNQLINCLSETSLSPEKLAPYFSISNMTYRRWNAKKNKTIKSSELDSIMNGIFSLIAEGHLSMESKELQKIVNDNFKSSAYFNSVMKTLGLSKSVKSKDVFNDRILDSLSTIGKKDVKRSYVESQLAGLPKLLKKTGKELAERTLALVKVIQSKQISKEQKWVAYGALFYLFLPFDLIPDHIPIFGYLDDFAILGFAMAYYKNLEIKKSAI